MIGDHELGWADARWASRLRTALLTAVAVLIVLVIVFPFLWIVLSSFRDPAHFLSFKLSDAIPRSFHIEPTGLMPGRRISSLWPTALSDADAKGSYRSDASEIANWCLCV